jgi:hypothetical protein
VPNSKLSTGNRYIWHLLANTLLLHAMQRYRQSMSILGGCRLVVSPLGSKLITLGAGLACFEMRPENVAAN